MTALIVAAIMAPQDCLHPLEARGRYTGGSVDQPWDTCAACGCTRLVDDDDDLEQPWEPAVLARMVPEFLAAAGLKDASEDEAEAFLDARRKAREATATAEGPCDLCGAHRPAGLLKRVVIGGEWIWTCTDKEDTHG